MLAFTPKNAVATPDAQGGLPLVIANIPANLRQATPTCPTGFTSASAEPYNDPGVTGFQPANQGFYVAFN